MWITSTRMGYLYRIVPYHTSPPLDSVHARKWRLHKKVDAQKKSFAIGTVSFVFDLPFNTSQKGYIRNLCIFCRICHVSQSKSISTVVTKMGIHVGNLRKELEISDDQQWREINEDAKEIFLALDIHLQTRNKSKGWKSVSRDVRNLACTRVMLFTVDH